MFKLLKVFAILLLFDIHLSHATKIDPVLLSKLEKGEKANVLVSFHKGVRSTLLEASKSVKNNVRSARKNAIVQALQDNANTAQESVIGKLSARSGGGFQYFRKYWTSNRLFVKEADLATVKTIEEDPNVSAIKLETNMGIPKNEPINGRIDGEPEFFWNILHIQVPEAWEELGGKKGEGVIVANIDTGVRYTHENLKPSFRGEYGWLDGVNGTLEPFDYQGHGTGMMGILVADSVQIEVEGGKEEYRPLGVAPGAKWMACRGCGGHEEGNECNAEHILNCIQFMSCPTLPDGSNPDCSKAPHVVSLSISAGREGEGYDDDLLTMKNLGIIPVGGIGNKGAACGSSESPANSPWVIGVGSTNIKDICWGASGAGPSPNGTIKPDIVAPGSFIMTTSANVGGPEDDRLYFSGGTSSATPHVAGVVALLHVRNPELTFEEAYQFITQSADVATVDLKQQNRCNESTEVIPNNLFGYGRINALKAVKAQTLALAAGK